MDLDTLLRSLTGFDWDSGNDVKNWEKHQVRRSEAEEVFFHRPLVVADDKKPSSKEKRYAALGITGQGRKLLVMLLHIMLIQTMRLKMLFGQWFVF